MLLIIWLILTLVLSLLPVSGPQTDMPLDKVVHFVFYGIGAILFYRYFAIRISNIRAVYLSVIIASAYGVFMEILQHFMPYRSFSFGDMAANASGALIFCIFYTKWRGHEA
ncbi:MAG: VanZ family protein [Nitrospirota bacterium]